MEDSVSEPAPAAAPVEDEDDAVPPAALEPLAELLPGQVQFALGVLTEPLTAVSPTLPCTFVSGQAQLAAEPPEAALPLAFELPEADGEELLEPEADGDDVLLEDEPDEMLPPAAELVLGAEVEPVLDD
jgi:hypothetical protein